jgi:hypothetical protein
MPIVRHTLSVTTAADGSADCILRMYDQDDTGRGQITFRTDAGPDLQARAEAQAAMHIANTDAQLADMEYQQIIGNED